MTFRVGQKVVCINDSWETEPRPLKKNSIYEITRVGFYPGCRDLLVDLAGVHGSCMEYPNYYAHRFRPVVERKTDISVFEKLLDTKSIEELVP